MIDPAHILWSQRGSERAGRPLLVMMHGWSYDETHLFSFADGLPRDLVVASVRARQAEEGGFAWFPSRGNPIGNPQPSVAAAAAEMVLRWLDTLAESPQIGLLGFYQGGAVALQLERFAHAVNVADFVVDDEQPGDDKLALLRPPVFWGRGARDGVIPASALRRARRWMDEHTARRDQALRRARP
ncbi:MAG TPA: hypothetical protein VE441_16550 [Mycobacterium sp.]|nr:hypothetical protein [Mycobacterium sp.]